MTQPIATVGELIAALQAFDDHAPVRLAVQPAWPFEHDCGPVTADPTGTVWIAEGNQIGYLPGQARDAVGWYPGPGPRLRTNPTPREEMGDPSCWLSTSPAASPKPAATRPPGCAAPTAAPRSNRSPTDPRRRGHPWQARVGTGRADRPRPAGARRRRRRGGRRTADQQPGHPAKRRSARGPARRPPRTGA